MNTWEGIGSSIVAAVIGALVAVLAVHLSNVSSRHSWYHQRRVEAFAQVLDGWQECWEVAGRNWDSYPRREAPSIVDTRNSEWSSLDDVLDRRDGDLIQAVNRTRAAVGVWALHLDESGTEIEAATKRAIEVLHGEWDRAAHVPKGSLVLYLDTDFMEEWDRYLDLSRRWHRAHSTRAKKPINKTLDSMWRSKPKTKIDILEEFGDVRGFSVD